MPTIKALKERWDAALRDAVLDWLAGKGVRPDSLGVHEGRTDLRGLPAREPRMITDPDNPAQRTMWGATICDGVTWESLDFSHSTFDHVTLKNSTVRDCVFDHIRTDVFWLYDTLVEQCSFRAANLRHQNIGAMPGSPVMSVRHCDFTKANLSRLAFTATSIEDCDFTNANLNNTEHHQISLLRCTFHETSMNDVMFWNGPRGLGVYRPELPASWFRDVDFSTAKMNNVGFDHCRFDSVSLPPEAWVFTGFGPIAARAKEIWGEGEDSWFGRTVDGELEDALEMAPGEVYVAWTNHIAAAAPDALDRFRALLVAAGATIPTP